MTSEHATHRLEDESGLACSGVTGHQDKATVDRSIPQDQVQLAVGSRDTYCGTVFSVLQPPGAVHTESQWVGFTGGTQLHGVRHPRSGLRCPPWTACAPALMNVGQEKSSWDIGRATLTGLFVTSLFHPSLPEFYVLRA